MLKCLWGVIMINSKKVLSLMVLNNVKRKDLCKLLEISYQTLTKKLHGKAAFKDHEMKKISEVLNVCIDDLYN